MYKYLDKINTPDDLRLLPESALEEVSNEVREFIIDTIAQIGGHFGAGLGVVELTVALHYVYNTPLDKIVIDTGHQGYPHKVLTDRKELLKTIRQKNGISGFLKRSESPYDAFGAGHASTSISAALGLAAARDINGDKNRVVAVIGDGAMTGGLAFEAMNNCGVQKRDITVILNDNNYSIAPNVSALSNYFNEIYSLSQVQRLRENVWDLAGKIDHIGDRLRKIATRLEDGVKAIVTPGVLFEALGFNYFGPINGNNIQKLTKILKSIKDLKGPVLLHIVTQKGYGYKHAIKEKGYLHAIGKIDKVTGLSLAKQPTVPSPPNYQDVFGEAVLELCKDNNKIVAITAAMPDGTGLNIVQDVMPERVFDVGIAEGHAVTFAAGLACEGVIPIVAIYSTFLQRAYDHIIHDVALQKLHVIFALDRAGLVGADGPTHHGVLDIPYLRSIQGMIVMAPKDEQELRDMLWSSCYKYSGPIAIRYPRGGGMNVPLMPMNEIKLGTWEYLSKGESIAFLPVGRMIPEAIKAKEILNEHGVNPSIINARFIKPLDKSMLNEIAKNYDLIVTMEDGQLEGGFGSAVIEYLSDNNLKTNVIRIGIADIFVEHGTQEELYKEIGLDGESIANKILKLKPELIFA